MDAIQALRERRTVRVYDETKPVTREQLETIVDCGRLAATARNVQPWEFVVITDAGMRGRVAGLTQHGKHIANASACIAVFCTDSTYYLEDGCAATQNMLVAAWALGLGACWVAGDKKDYADTVRKLLNVPDHYTLVSLVAAGLPIEITTAPKKAQKNILFFESFKTE